MLGAIRIGDENLRLKFASPMLLRILFETAKPAVSVWFHQQSWWFMC